MLCLIKSLLGLEEVDLASSTSWEVRILVLLDMRGVKSEKKKRV